MLLKSKVWWISKWSSLVYKFFDKNSKDGSVNNEIKQNEQLAEELHKPIVKNFKKEEFILHLKKIFGCWFSSYAINKQV